jgi:hypothetical protein
MANLGRHGPKTRTACLTCKKRRVKCDQAQPACKRCIKAGRICAGYQLELISSSPAQVPHSTVITSSTTLLSAFSATQQEWQAYGLYSRRISFVLGGTFDKDLWQNLFIQIASTETTVRLALFALGTLVRHTESNDSRHISDCLCPHCRQALRYYNKSISSFSDYLLTTPSNESINVALASCALFICIELYRTNDRNAISLVGKGSSILSQVSELYVHHQPHPRLLNLFNRLRIATGMFTIDFYGNTSINSLSLDSEQLHFENLQVARDMLQKLIPKAQKLKLAGFQAHRIDASGSQYARSLSAVAHEQDIAQAELASWHKAFERFISSHPGQELSPLAKQLLHAKFLAAKIYINTALAVSQDIYLEHIDDFKAIVAAAEEGIRYASNDEKWLGFTFEGGFLASLYLVGLKCRDPATRRKILGLMHHTNAKEGLWCRSEAACVLTRVMDIEEGRSTIGFQGTEDEGPSPTPPRFYDVSCEVNYRKSGSLFVDVTYTLYDKASPEPWRTFKETLHIDH